MVRPRHRNIAIMYFMLMIDAAGAPLDEIQGSKTSVYVAASTRDYEVILYRDPELTPKYMGTGIGTSLLANRISWFFDFRGPSITLDTACSSGLAAVHMACQSLKSKESNLVRSFLEHHHGS